MTAAGPTAVAAAAVVVVGTYLTVAGDHTTGEPGPTSLIGVPATTPAVPGSVTPMPTPSAVVRPSSGPQRPNGFAVGLGRGTDWVAVVRRDGELVRPKVPQLGPLDVRWTGAVTGQSSPYRVSWSAGAPEQDHTDATTWLGIGEGGSATVTVPALPRAATVSLYVGAVGADVVVTGSGQVSWSHQGGDPGSAVVKVPVPASGAPTVLVVSVARVAPGGTVGLAAVTLV